MNSLSQREIDEMARTYTEGYRMGFITGRKDITKKKTVNIRYHLGFERMVKAAVLQFREMGLQTVIPPCTSCGTDGISSEMDLQEELQIRSLIMTTDRTVRCFWIRIL